MSDATSLEEILRKMVRQEVSRLLGVEIDPDDDDDLRRLVVERAAAMRRARTQ